MRWSTRVPALVSGAVISSGEIHFGCDDRHIHSSVRSVISGHSRQAAGLDSEARLAHVVAILEVACRCPDPNSTHPAGTRRRTGAVADTRNDSPKVTLPGASTADPQLGLHLCR